MAEPTDLGAAVGLSPAHFQRVFKRLTGITPRQYADAVRLGRLKSRLREGDSTVTTALYDAGYGSSRGLYEHAATRLGMTPDTYRRGGPTVVIDFTLIDCPVGRLLLAATERGVCRVSLADADAALEADLRDEFPAALVRRNDAVLSDWACEVLRRTRGEPPARELPLDVRATAFQWRVWQLLQAIPPGETRSYLQIAQALGQPTAARAVARACATNPVSILIPCHRVVRGDGGLGGYRWGLERKRKLLKQEKDDPASEA